jgi:hypothetical protein
MSTDLRKCRHDERGPEHVRMHLSQASPLTDRPNPPAGGAPVEALPISPAQDRSFEALTDGEVDGSRRAGHERDGRGLGALAQDAQRSVAPLTAQVLDVGGARFAHPQPVETEKDSECRVVAVVLLGGEQEHAELGAVETPSFGGVDPGAADVLGRVRRDPSVDVRKPIETGALLDRATGEQAGVAATDRRQLGRADEPQRSGSSDRASRKACARRAGVPGRHRVVD